MFLSQQYDTTKKTPNLLILMSLKTKKKIRLCVCTMTTFETTRSNFVDGKIDIDVFVEAVYTIHGENTVESEDAIRSAIKTAAELALMADVSTKEDVRRLLPRKRSISIAKAYFPEAFSIFLESINNLLLSKGPDVEFVAQQDTATSRDEAFRIIAFRLGIPPRKGCMPFEEYVEAISIARSVAQKKKKSITKKRQRRPAVDSGVPKSYEPGTWTFYIVSLSRVIAEIEARDSTVLACRIAARRIFDAVDKRRQEDVRAIRAENALACDSLAAIIMACADSIDSKESVLGSKQAAQILRRTAECTRGSTAVNSVLASTTVSMLDDDVRSPLIASASRESFLSALAKSSHRTVSDEPVDVSRTIEKSLGNCSQILSYAKQESPNTSRTLVEMLSPYSVENVHVGNALSRQEIPQIDADVLQHYSTSTATVTTFDVDAYVASFIDDEIHKIR